MAATGTARLLGQEVLVSTLLRAFREDRNAHAYLVVGPAGSGKSLLVDRLATELLGGPTRTHPDLIWVEPDGASLKISQVQQVIHDVHLRPTQGRRRVAVLEGVDRMTPEAANAFLKTLEEPPDYAVFLLTARNESLLPATVLSRCQLVRLQSVDEAEIASWLQREHGAEPAAAAEAAAYAGGVPGRALAWLDETRRRVVDEVWDWAQQLPGASDLALFEAAERWDEDRDLLDDRLNVLLAIFRDALAIRSGAREDQLVHAARLADIRRLADRITTEGAAAAVRKVHETKRLLARRASSRLALEVLFLDCRRHLL